MWNDPARTATRAVLPFEMSTLAILTLAGLALGAAPAAAAPFSVSPARVELDAGARSALVVVQNLGEEDLVLSASIFAWDQVGDDPMVLDRTREVTVFPPLLFLEPGETGRVRVGVAFASHDAEAAYRLYLEELPPLDQIGTPDEEVFTERVGLPVFVTPSQAHPRTIISGGRVEQGELSFWLLNVGNVHVEVEQILVRGLDARGDTVFTDEIQGWYLLRDTWTPYQFTLSPTDCRASREIEIEVWTGLAASTRTLPMPPEACGD